MYPICGGEFVDDTGGVKVEDHCHITGDCRGVTKSQIKQKYH